MTSRNTGCRPDNGGFTLIELLVAMVVAAILVTIALPSYRGYVVRGNRSAAQAAMMDIANRQHQFLLARREFADAAALAANGYALPPEVSGNYTLTMAVNNAATPPTFQVIMTPSGTQSDDGALTLDHRNTKLPADKWRK